MEFISREKELSDLEFEYQNGHSFVAVYGRRRVGKTALIQEFIKNKPALYYLATEESESQSMRRFSQSLSQFAGKDFLAKASFDDWIDLFKIFVSVQTAHTKVLVIDEFQYLVNVNPAFASIFQKAWDEVLSKNDVMVIICGSYINMITKEVLSEKSPLYGRRTAQIRLAPLLFWEIREHFSNKSFSDVVELYSVTGGVPKYIEFFDNNRALMSNVEHYILNKNGFLYEEPAFLLDKEVKEPINYFSILKAIADERHKVSEISALMQVEGNQLSPYLATLQELDLLEKRVPVTESNPEKSKKGLYYIKDLFIRFWFKFVFPNKGELEIGNEEPVLERIRHNFIDNHVAFVYEEVCRNIFINLCRRKEIDFSFSRIGSFWDSNTEIDVVAVDDYKKRIFAGECKYYNDDKPVDVSVYSKLLEKCENNSFKGYKITYGLFSKSGFSSHLIDIAKNNKKLILINEDSVVG